MRVRRSPANWICRRVTRTSRGATTTNFARRRCGGCWRPTIASALKKHFSDEARRLYGYAPRNPSYQNYKTKVFKTSIDLFKTGKSKQQMLREGRITLSGSADGGKHAFGGTLTVRFAFKGGSGRHYKSNRNYAIQVTPAQMIREMQAIRDEESADMAQQFEAEYMSLVTAYRAARKRVRNS